MKEQSRQFAGDADERTDLYCLQCGYNLRGLSGDPRVCPECGRTNELDESRVSSEIVEKMRRRLNQQLRWSVWSAVLGGLSLAITVYSQGIPCCFFTFLVGTIWFALAVAVVGDDSRTDCDRQFFRALLGYHGWVMLIVALLATEPVIFHHALPYLAGLVGASEAWTAGPYYALWVVAAMVTTVLLSIRPHQRRKDRLEVYLDKRARDKAQQWHYNRLRTRPEKRWK